MPYAKWRIWFYCVLVFVSCCLIAISLTSENQDGKRNFEAYFYCNYSIGGSNVPIWVMSLPKRILAVISMLRVVLVFEHFCNGLDSVHASAIDCNASVTWRMKVLFFNCTVILIAQIGVVYGLGAEMVVTNITSSLFLVLLSSVVTTILMWAVVLSIEKRGLAVSYWGFKPDRYLISTISVLVAHKFLEISATTLGSVAAQEFTIIMPSNQTCTPRRGFESSKCLLTNTVSFICQPAILKDQHD